MLEKLFKLQEHGTSVRTEVIAGVTTFLTMSYIIFVNPDILSTTGMDRNAVFVATCLAAALGSIVMALVANWPIGMAPGMGLNAFFAFTVVGAMGFSWQQALGAVFISGIIFLFLTVTGIRRWLVEGIPHSLRSAIAAGIGMFLALIGLKSAGVVVDNPATLVGLGDLREAGPLLAIAGFLHHCSSRCAQGPWCDSDRYSRRYDCVDFAWHYPVWWRVLRSSEPCAYIPAARYHGCTAHRHSARHSGFRTG